MSLQDTISIQLAAIDLGQVSCFDANLFADEIINKVLDAVDRKIDAEGGKFDPSDDLEKGYDDGLAAALKAVSQLRPKS